MGMVFKVISTNESLEWEEGKVRTEAHIYPSISHEVMGSDAMIFVF